MGHNMNEKSKNMSLSRRDREKLRRKEAILEAAVHLFAQKGFNETKLEDVAALAEFGKGTLYNYFENKNDLLISAFEYALGKVIEYLEAQLSQVTDPVERIRMIVIAHFEYYRSNEDFLRVIMSRQQVVGQSNYGGSGAHLRKRLMVLREMMIGEIQSAINSGHLKQGSAARYASYLTGMIHHQVRSLHNNEIKMDEVDPNEIVDIFLNGAIHE